VRILRWLAIAAVVVVALVVAGWYFFVRSDPEPRATITETPVVTGATGSPGGSSGSGAAASALDGTYAVKPGGADDFVGYRVTEKLVANVVESTATGRTNDVTATMTIRGTTVSDVTVTADLRTLTSDSSLRDGRIRDQGLESNRFPLAKFVLTTPIQLAAQPAAGQTVTTDATGDFTLHGVTKRVTISMLGRWDGKTVQVVGTMPIAFSDYGIRAPSSPLVASIDDHGEMELKLFFQQGSS
jgi:polyisoprenoid-binding protein YceI